MLRNNRKTQKEAAKSSEIFNYTILAPKNFRANTNFTLNLTIHNAEIKFDEAILVRVSIEDVDDEAGLKLHRHVAMNPNVTEVVSIPIGDVPRNRNYRLMVKGVSGIEMDHKEDLHLQTQNHIIFIQTDKGIYKPSDCLKFRVLVLDWELKAAPIEDNELKIDITDPRRNLLKKWNGVNTTSGVFSGEFQLSDQPNLGFWTILASVGDQVKEKTIKVAEYVLPKFEIGIDSPGNFMPEDEKAYVVVRAKYTDGHPMKGTAVVEVVSDGKALVTKTVAVNGQETIEFDLETELQFHQNEIYKRYEVKAQVTENLTGLSQTCGISFNVNSIYVIRTNPEIRYGCIVNFKRGSTADLTISVRKQNGSVPSFDDPSKKKIVLIKEQFFDEKMPTIKTIAIHRLNENGDVVLTLDIAENETKFSLQVNYASQKTDLRTFSTFANAPNAENTTKVERNSTDDLRLETTDLKKQYKINKPVNMEVISSEPIPSYTYVIVARGKILESKTITPIFDDSYTSVFVHRFSFVPHSGYAPEARVTVYCVTDGMILTSSFTVELYDDFKNFIDLDISQDVAKPGDIVDIKVKSNKNAYIGLLGIDQGSLILRSGNDLARKEVWNAFMKAGPINGGSSGFPTAGLIFFSNLKISQPLKECTLILNLNLKGGGCHVPKQTVRKDFPETWIWDTIDNKNFDGSMTLSKKVPDSLTTWVLTGFSIDPVNGLALIKAPLKLRVQQQFHISLNLPYSVKRGEIVTIPCAIFNYFPNDIEAEVTLENELGEFEFADAPETGENIPKRPKVQFRTTKLTIHSKDAVNVHFIIRPTRVGSISLKVSAVSSVASDCVIQTLNVECEGVPQFVNKAVFIDLREKSQTGAIDLIIDVPKVALPESTRIEINCVGDLLGGTIKNLHQLIRLPSGCGEQNMLNFVPNIVVLNYLKNTHQLTDEIDAKAKKYMEIGYQTELTYKHKDGSYSTFGEEDGEMGSTWLTAFVARSFQQAQPHIFIQEHIIAEALKWLSKMQSADGRFVEKGSIFDKEMQSGAANGVALTAYVLTAFLVTEKSKATYKSTIQKAIGYITKSIENCSDAYALAVCAYALQSAGSKSKKVVLDRLLGLAKSDRVHKWWEKSMNISNHGHKESKTLNVEITAYALLTLLQNADNDTELLPIAKWLLNQRNDQGGFEGTQDTNIGIEALANFALKIATKENAMNIGIKTSNGDQFTFDVNKDNSLVLQSQKLDSDIKWICVNATGKGASLLELSYRYHVNAPDAQPAFLLKPNAVLVDEDHMSLETKVSYQPPTGDSVQQSNMVILEVSLPSGFVLNTDHLDSLKSTIPIIKRTETKNDDTVAIIYFEYLTEETVGLKIIGFRKHIVTEQRPTPIVIYDYYDNALSAREFYSLK